MESLKALIDLLNADDFLLGDDDIDIAKGKYKRPESWKEFRNILKRK
jgi:hypothetical protein